MGKRKCTERCDTIRIESVFMVERSAREVGKLRRKDDHSLFQELYCRYNPLLFRVAARYFPDAPQEREDAVQNAWLKAFRHLEKARELPEDKVPLWLICITKNETISLLRRRRPHLPLEEWLPATSPAASSGSVREAIDALPEIYRAVLELKFVAGYTNREIARMLGISESAVGTRILRGRAILKGKLDAEGVSE